jgi:hypothetical protein
MASQTSTEVSYQRTVIETPAPPGADGSAAAIERMVGGIIGYSRWPATPQRIRLCVAGPSPLTARLADRTVPSGRTITVTTQSIAAVSASSCDAVIVGRASGEEQAQLVRRFSGAPVLTMTAADIACDSGIMFCFRRGDAGGMTFDLNIDAVSRSMVRVDPRVLSLSRSLEQRR